MLKKLIFLAKTRNSLLIARPISNAPISFSKGELELHKTHGVLLNHMKFSVEINENPTETSATIFKEFQSAVQLPDLINSMSKLNKNDTEPEQLAKVFGKMFELYKNDFSINQVEITRSFGFINCCKLLKFHAPRMMPNDLVICLKALISLNLSPSHRIVQQLLHHIKEDINELSLSQLAFLNYLLAKVESTPLVNALRIAIPIVFDLNVSLKLDHENPEEMLKLLHYVTSTDMRVSDKSMMSIITALTLHGTSLSVYSAQTIISATRKLPFKYFENYDILQKLIQNCIHILNTRFEESAFPKMESTLEKLIKKYKQTNIDAFYNETFFNNCVKHLTDNDLGFSTAFYVLRKLNEIHFVSYDLLKYIDQQIIYNHTNLSTMPLNHLMVLISGFSTADYKSENWDIIKSILHENPVFHDDINLNMPHLKFVCELLSLNFISKIYFDKVLNEDFLIQYIKRNSSKNFANLPQIRLIYQTLKLLHPEYDGVLPESILLDIANDAIPTETLSMNESYKGMLDSIFGSNTTQMNVQTKHGHLLDFIVSFDNQNNAVTLPCRIQYFENMPKSQVRSVAVFFHTRKNSPINLPMKLKGIINLRRRTLEVLGIKEVDIAVHCLELLPESEKMGYIEREIRSSL